jgi:hypothetical protein
MRMREIGEEMAAVVEDLGAHRYGELDRIPARSVLRLSLPVPATPTLEPALALEEREVPQIGLGEQDDVPAVSPVSTVRTTLRHVFLAPKAQRAVSAAAASHLDAGAIVEHGSL